ncbi:MAG: beta-N-acetylhexosaminidase [Proteobacteria bacterium]|nr:beta-N-acetylhexosaminidase [Pseudomonadota bacterium]
MNPPIRRPRGPVMIDVAGTALTDEERERLRDPLVGGVILFARNYTGSEQLRALTAEIRGLRDPALIIAVDHEGGRVQRFRTDGFTRLPSMRSLGALWAQDHLVALDAARATGVVLAAELRAHGVDLSFTPVLDLDYGCCRAIGNRAFHRDPQVVAALAQALCAGMAEAGMGCVGKHFPGHGFVEADSHHDVPVDERDFDTVWNEDIAPYRHRLGRQLAGVMPAHVVYPNADPSPEPQPAGFSPFWLKEVLRDRLGFQWVIFSDDLNMEGARVAGDIVGRAKAAYAAQSALDFRGPTRRGLGIRARRNEVNSARHRLARSGECLAVDSRTGGRRRCPRHRAAGSHYRLETHRVIVGGLGGLLLARTNLGYGECGGFGGPLVACVLRPRADGRVPFSEHPATWPANARLAPLAGG